MGARESARPHIGLRINGIKVNALVDSGSCRTLMNGELYECLKLPPPTRSAPDLVTLTGTTVPTAGVVDVRLSSGLMLNNVVLTSGMGVPLLIGTDTLEANGGILDYSRNVLLLGGREYDFIQQLTKSPGVTEVFLEGDLDRLTNSYPDFDPDFIMSSLGCRRLPVSSP